MPNAALRMAALVAAACLLGAAPAAAGPACTSHRTVLLDGRLRVFAVPVHGGGTVGVDYRACRLPDGHPVSIGSHFDGPGIASSRTIALVSDGVRHLGAEEAEVGEGGADASIAVTDLARSRVVAFAGPVFRSHLPPFRLAPGGRMLWSDDDGAGTAAAFLSVPASRRAAGPLRLSETGSPASEVARAGAVAYWTERTKGGAVARSAPTGRAAPEEHVLEPVAGLRRPGACDRRTGATIAATPRVRVVRRADRGRFACERGRATAVRLPPQGADASRAADPWIAGDRWVLAVGRAPGERSAGACRLVVVDIRAGRRVTATSAAATGRPATLLRDGTAAWFDVGGRLLVQAPADDAPTLLASAEERATDLASSRATVYWTAAGRPQRWTAPTTPTIEAR